MSKIVFLCGSLEPGRDGVGDYTSRLAVELFRQGHKTGLLAFNDQYILKELEGVYRSDEMIELPILRLPSNWPDKKRIKRAKFWIDSFNPDWVSLQFVIFSFHPKGLPFGLSKKFLRLGNQRRWHIMFHELWLGIDINASKKNILWGQLQKYIIKKIILGLKPILIHTQLRLFQAQLINLGFDAHYLPLFGNIPYIKDQTKAEKKEGTENSERIIRLVHFASVHAGAPINEFAREVAKYSHKSGMPVTLTFIGRSGPEQKNWIDAFQSEGLFTENLGELSPTDISKILSSSAMGISSTPIVLAEKSGSIAAMREHGLSVLCVTYPWIAPKEMNFEPHSGIFEYRNGNFEELIEIKIKYPCNSNAGSVATKLAESFTLHWNN